MFKTVQRRGKVAFIHKKAFIQKQEEISCLSTELLALTGIRVRET